VQPAHTDARHDLASGRAHDLDGPAIEVEDLVKVYRGGKTTTTALEGVSFAVDRGEIFGLLGPNGSGKTTTVRILVTLLHKTSGAARVGGFDTDRQPDQVRRLVGYAGQSIGVDDDLTAAENLALGGLLHHLPHDAAWKRAAELLDAFSLTEVASQRAGRLSGGCGGGWTWPRRWCTGPRCCSWTSPPPAWTRSPATPCGRSCGAAAEGRG
jgi:ABC-type lipopolysaccharide export system ATPase subunit